MIFVTGDCHGDFSRFSTKNFAEQKTMTKNDYVIICGDFGGVFNYQTESPQEKHDLDWLESKNFSTLFVDGNHENYDRLNDYPVEEWCGGKVHRIRPSVIHLMRGQIYEIDGKKYFTFGGASSHDISDGILEMDDPDFHSKRRFMHSTGQQYRINHFSWWKEELPSVEEMEEGRRNLAKHDYEVDYIISHCCATSTQTLLSGGDFEADIETDYLEEIRQKTKFKKWFFGHYHKDVNLNLEEIQIYTKILRLDI